MAANDFIDTSEIPWWNRNYPFRQHISIATKSNVIIDTNMPVKFVIFDVLDNQLRSDLADIEIVHFSGITDATPSFEVLPRKTAKAFGHVNVIFNIPTSFTGNLDNQFFVYYGNPRLRNQPTRQSYTENIWPITSVIGGFGWSFTRPGTHWINGVSSTKGATATFSFNGSRCQIVGRKGPDCGQAKIYLDNELKSTYDFYSDTDEIVQIVAFDELPFATHDVEIKVMSKARAAATGKNVKLIEAKHDYNLTVVPGSLEIIPDLRWSSIMVGG